MGDAVPYPTAVVCLLLANQFAERFTFYGIRAIFSLYFSEELLFDEDITTIIYHLYSMLVFGFPIMGAIIADSCLGKYSTVIYFSWVYVFGGVVLTISSIGTNLVQSIALAFTGLALLSIGTGCVKPCATAFGGDQFVLPQQEKERATFFYLFYFAVNIGNLVSNLSVPLLRKYVFCFGKHTCYALGFGVSTVLMACSILVFVIGKSMYIITEPQGNMVVKMSNCIGYAVSQKCKSKGVKKDHWLDFAVDKHGQELVDEIKIVFRILYLYLPIPLFWALLEQMATGWTFQARRMKGEVGNLFTILPDQMQIFNPLMVLILIPFVNYCLYPLLNKCGLLTTPLQKIAVGGFITAFAFLLTGLIELRIEKTLPVLPEPGNGQIRIFNILPCDIEVTCDKLNGGEAIAISKFDFFVKIDIKIDKSDTYNYTMKGDCSNANGAFNVTEEKAVAYFFNTINKPAEYVLDDIDKTVSGNPNVRVMVNLNGTMKIKITKHGREYISIDTSDIELHEINPDVYNIQFGDSYKIEQRFLSGGVYTVAAIATSDNTFDVKAIVVTSPNKVHILWMIPQYTFISLGECLLAITGIEFSYSQAPVSMKSVMQAAWLLASSFGQLLVVIISAIENFNTISAMFFFYSGLMLVDMIIFSLMTLSYVYV